MDNKNENGLVINQSNQLQADIFEGKKENKALINATYGYNIDVERKYYDIVTNDYIDLLECIANFITYSPYSNELLSENVRKDFNKLYIELRCKRIELIKENSI